MIFYAGQPIVIAALFLFAGLFARRTRRTSSTIKKRRTRFETVAFLAALAYAVVWGATSFRCSSVTAPPNTLRAVQWNVMAGRLGWTGVYETLHDLDADVIVLVEAYQAPQERAEMLARYLPGYNATAEHDGLMILSRGPLDGVDFGALDRGGHFVKASTTLDARSFDVMAIDIESDPRRFRKLPLAALAKRAASEVGRPLLVAGDFNTPPDSVHYAKLRETMRNGFETVGWGYGPTWPSMAPVVRLDQFWVNDGLKLYSCSSNWTIRSDHRPRVLEFGF